MIQRIQTVYLSLVVIISVIALFQPLAAIITPANVFDLSSFGFTANPPIDALHTSTWSLLSVSLAIPILALATIFLFKKRKWQLTLSYINFLLMDLYYITIIATLWFADKQLALSSRWIYHYSFILQIINMILTFLAIRAINKDEALVRSLDRLR
ncbi:MAG: DUF4293 domain-containing protein [Microbacter sp.]